MSNFDTDAQSQMADLQTEYGDPIEYWLNGETPINIQAIPSNDGLQDREQDGGRTRGQEINMQVQFVDVPNPKPNKDFVVVPGTWVRSSEATVRLRVAKILNDQSTQTQWVLALGQKR